MLVRPGAMSKQWCSDLQVRLRIDHELLAAPLESQIENWRPSHRVTLESTLLRVAPPGLLIGQNRRYSGRCHATRAPVCPGRRQTN